MQLTRKQNEYIRNANSRWNFKIGAVRSGKTFVDIAYMIPHRLRAVKDELGLNVILGVSRETIERNVLQPMREIYTEELIGNIDGRNHAKICGQDVYCLGAEKISQVAKIQGSSIKYCYGDEVAKWNKEVFIMLESRLDKTYSCFDGSCNPESPSHWLKSFLDKPDLNAYIQKYVIDDNSFLPPFFVDNLKQEYAGTVYYDRLILGEWTLAEGLIYPMYVDAIADPPQNSRPLEYCLSIDYGTQNAFAVLLWERHEKTWYAINEYYYSGRDTGIQKTDEDYANDLDKFIYNVPSDKIKTIIDPSAASMIATLRQRSRYKVIHAKNAIDDGLRETASCMKLGKIKFSPNLKNWKNEVQGYVWDPVKDKPVEFADHLMDAMRYFVKTMHIIKDKTEYKPLWN